MTEKSLIVSPSLDIAIVHPDLGIGGAERLIVDVAVGLQRRHHHLTVFTSHHASNHCFPETADGTLNIIVYGDFWPRTTYGHLHVLWALVRSFWLATCLLLQVLLRRTRYDIIITDQVSASIPLLKFCAKRVLFYCHFPDQLLTQRPTLLKRVYRAPFDLLEQITTGLADLVVVNSQFTKTIYKSTFPRLKIEPLVVYPGVTIASTTNSTLSKEKVGLTSLPTTRKYLFLSINRFERKKNIELLVHAFQRFLDQQSSPNAVLVLAGGYDSRVEENVIYHKKLVTLCEFYDLKHTTLFQDQRNQQQVNNVNVDVMLLPSITESQKLYLLSQATALLYSPSNEHFGIVPVEAMYNSVPVIAINNGGPKESIEPEITGFLCSERPGEDIDDFVHAMKTVSSMSKEKRQWMGSEGRQRVESRFSQTVFINGIESAIVEMMGSNLNDHFFSLFAAIMAVVCTFTWTAAITAFLFFNTV